MYKNGWVDHLCVSVERLLLRHGPHQRHVLQQTHVRLCEQDGEVGDGGTGHLVAGYVSMAVTGGMREGGRGAD